MKKLLVALSRQMKTLKGFFLVASVTTALLVFLGSSLTSSLLYEKLIAQRTVDMSQGIAQQTFNSLYQALRSGGSRQQLDQAIAADMSAFPDAQHRIAVFPATSIEKLYGGRATATPEPEDVKNVFSSGKTVTSQTPQEIRYVYPLAAETSCVQCHKNVHAGDVLGVVAIEHTLQPISIKVRLYFISLFLVMGCIVLLAGGGVYVFAMKRIKGSVDLFREKIEAVGSVKDLNQLDISQTNLGFAEFDEIFHHINQLVDRLKNVAVDKDILEFEVKLLEKFIITSNVMRDWREFIKELLLEINSIIDAYALLTIFRIEDEGYEWEVFWRNTPSAATIELFERIVRAQLETNPHFQGTSIININHQISDASKALPELSRRDIELQTKSLLLETPKIGGIVGIGVQSTLAQDPVRHIVIGSILTSLLNLVGSVKAIYKYTKDLEYYATRDPLTDLYNQRMFWELLGYEVGRAERHHQEFGVMVLDMDNFKTVNDRYGHPFGDAFLQAFAKLLHQAVRQGDMIVRYGGDEFAVILPEAGESQAYEVAERVAELLEKFTLDAPDGARIKATTSIGIAICPAHGTNPRDLFLVADNMMYKAKKAGKNCIALPSEDEMAEVFKKASDKGMMIVKALEEHRIIPYFQPIINMASGEAIIHELLMRIQVGDQVVAANEFIEEAEAMGLAHKMDYQLIEKAFAQVKEQGYQGMLFVNLSPKALIVGEFMNRIHKLAIQYAIDPSRIVFEITERETVSNLSLLEKFVLDLKSRGFSFAIDDFGSGFSSFHYIKRFPVDYIKIEGEFIRNILTDNEYRAFTKSIVTLAQELEIKTIAEYVEDQSIMDEVGRFGIDFAQGYHVGRPGPVLVVGKHS
ncbi:putative bifunctional diguanylate cyclase/phosphodiesterase [Sulfurimicrobium lacus]|nr:bifunctional diguanylate cyclase/phosphodiesterase [Sulfurimicrobium lacus]